MKIRNEFIAAALVALCASPVFAQESEEQLELRMQEAEAQLEEAVEQARQAERESERASSLSRLETAEVEVRLREAESRMAEAARQVADLSMRQLPRMERLERIWSGNRGPVLGITIGAEDSGEPVEGVEVLGVSPGGAAEETGIRAGDIITSINGESMTADSANEATEKLMDFMQGVEEGDELDIEYLRNGRSESVALTPRPMENIFAFSFGGREFPSAPDVRFGPDVKRFENFIWMSHDDGFGDMELVSLTERLGEYFGTAEGLLVVRAPDSEDMKLEDGDVILNIDGREPNSVAHAMRILGSYQEGEELKIEIMRDKRKRTIEIEIPDNRQSFAPAVVPNIQAIPGRAVIVETDRT